MMDVPVIHIRVRGRVQGVGFRAFVQRKATDFGLSGWVRNRSDGSVEFLMKGDQATLDAFLKACMRGSFFSRVTSVEPVGVPDAPVPPITNGIVEVVATV